jgi:hypothetical protein
MSSAPDANPLIEVNDLKVHFDLGGGSALDRLFDKKSVRRVVKAVDGLWILRTERSSFVVRNLYI